MWTAKSCSVPVVIMALSLISCSVEMKDKNGSDSAGPPAVESKSEGATGPSLLSLAQVKIRTQGLSQPNRYKIEFSWAEMSGSVRVSVDQKTKAIIQEPENVFIDSDVAGGSRISYMFEQLTEDGQVLTSFEVPVRTPSDLVLEGALDLKEHTKLEAERIFISKKMILKTMDKNLAIFTKELISDGGTILNYTAGTKAGREKNGRSGGSISIVAEQARGVLTVHLSGEAGGDGRNGVVTMGAHPGCAGTNAGNGGSAGSLSVQIQEGRGLQIFFESHEGPPGLRGRRGSVASGTPASEAVHPPCSRYTPEGVDGQAGSKGQVCLKMASDLDIVCY